MRFVQIADRQGIIFRRIEVFGNELPPRTTCSLVDGGLPEDELRSESVVVRPGLPEVAEVGIPVSKSC